MRGFFITQRNNQIYHHLTSVVAFLLTFSLVFSPVAGYAQAINLLNLPVPGVMIAPSSAFTPVLLKGMTIHPDNPLKFDFIIDSGNTGFTADEVKAESEKLVKYFLASMTIPKDDLWVNLSPYEDDRIIPDELGKTELGRDMLAQDYILKQLTASLIYPEKELGKKFWDKIYQRAKEEFGTSEIPVNTFNKVWILPESATIYEHEQTVYVVNSRLKVMLDSDYLAMEHNSVGAQNSGSVQEDLSVFSQIIREIILPEIEREVNKGAHFAPLRQIYHSLILAKWYKETIKNSLLSQVYVDKNMTDGVNVEDETIKNQIYAQYMQAYKKGVFNYIREDYDRLSNEIIPRKYFSGGINRLTNFNMIRLSRTHNPGAVQDVEGDGYRAEVKVTPQKDGVSSPILEDKAEIMIREKLKPRQYHLIKAKHIKQVVESGGNFGIRYNDGTKEGVPEGIEIFQMAFNPLQALKDKEILNVFTQIIERRYDVRVLEGKYGLGKTPDSLTIKGRKITATQLAKEMAQFLLDNADDNPYDVAARFRDYFFDYDKKEKKFLPPPELRQIFNKYMKIKPKVFDLEVVRDLIPSRGIIAELGAGHDVLGRKVLEYSDEKGLQVKDFIATDINKWPDNIDRSDKRMLFISQESPIEFPLSANSYDMIVVKWVLHHMLIAHQEAFLKDVERILKPGGQIIIFEALGANEENKEIWKAYKTELKNGVSWGPNGVWREENLRLNRDFRKLTDKQQKALHALEDYFGHNVVMNRIFMPQYFTYRTVGEFQNSLAELGFTENKNLRRVYGSAPFMRMGPPSIRLVFEKNKTPITLIKGDGGQNKAMVLIEGITPQERENLRTVLNVLVYQDLLRKDLAKETLDDIVIMGNERLDTFEEALQLLNAKVGNRLVILGGFGLATIPLIDAVVKQGFRIEISPGVFVDKKNWGEIKGAITEDTRANIIQYSEASIIKQVVKQIIEGWPKDYQNLINKIKTQGMEKVIVTEGQSPFIRKLLVNYRTMLDREGAFEKVGGHRILFLQKPHLQLRAKAAFDELFAAELRDHTVSTVSHTVSYDNVENDKISAFHDVIREAWRLVLYSDYGKGYINLRGIYPKGINGIPNGFWESIDFLFNDLDGQQKEDLARELMFMVAKEGLSIKEIIPEDNYSLRKFIEDVYTSSVQTASSPVMEVNGIHFSPTMNFDVGKFLSFEDIVKIRRKRQRDAKEVQELLLRAEKNNIELSIQGHLRGADIAGSSLDLPEFQRSLTELGISSFDQLPSTIAVASNFSTKVKFGLSNDPDAIVYVASDYGITEDNPMIFKGDVNLNDIETTKKQKFAPAFIFSNIFGLKGIKITLESISPMALAGGMESSNVFNVALIAAASMLSGANLSLAEIFNLAVELENNEFQGITGGQGHLSTLTGGINQQIWTSGIKNKANEFVNPYSAVVIPLLKDQPDLLENRMMFVQAGKEFANGKPVLERTATLTGIMWTDLLRDKDAVGWTLHKEKLKLTSQSSQALQAGDIETVSKNVTRYGDIRNQLDKRWINLMLDAYNHKQDVPEYAKGYAKKVFDPNHPDYSNFKILRMIYETKGEDGLRNARIYTMEPIASLIENAKKQGIAIMPLGAGGPGANLIAIDSKGKDHLKKFLEDNGIDEMQTETAKNIIRGTGTLKGYMEFKVGKEPMRFDGFGEIGLKVPALPNKELVKAGNINLAPLSSSPITDYDYDELKDILKKENFEILNKEMKDNGKGYELAPVVVKILIELRNYNLLVKAFERIKWGLGPFPFIAEKMGASKEQISDTLIESWQHTGSAESMAWLIENALERSRGLLVAQLSLFNLNNKNVQQALINAKDPILLKRVIEINLKDGPFERIVDLLKRMGADMEAVEGQIVDTLIPKVAEEIPSNKTDMINRYEAWLIRSNSPKARAFVLSRGREFNLLHKDVLMALTEAEGIEFAEMKELAIELIVDEEKWLDSFLSKYTANEDTTIPKLIALGASQETLDDVRRARDRINELWAAGKAGDYDEYNRISDEFYAQGISAWGNEIYVYGPYIHNFDPIGFSGQYIEERVGWHTEYRLDFLRAVSEGKMDVVQRFLAEGVDVNMRGSRGETALMWAAYFAQVDMIQLLLAKGADVNAKANNGDTALIIASQGYSGPAAGKGTKNEHERTVELLLANGADVNVKAKNGETALSRARNFFAWDIVDKLESHGATDNLSSSPIQGDGDGRNSDNLKDSSKKKENEFKDLPEGVTVRTLTIEESKKMMLQQAWFRGAANGMTDLIKLLMEEEGFNVNMKDPHFGLTALWLASQNGHDELVEYLLANGADPNIANDNRISPILIAAEKNHGNIVRMLLEKGARLDTTYRFGSDTSPLFMAAQEGNIEIVKQFLNKGVDVNERRRSDGVTPLMVAANQGNIQIVDLLVNFGADLYAKTKKGYNAKDVAKLKGHEDIVKVLERAEENTSSPVIDITDEMSVKKAGVVEGVRVRSVILEDENKFSKGRAVYLDPQKVSLEMFVEQKAREYDFNKRGVNRKWVEQQKALGRSDFEFEEFPGKTVRGFVDYMDDEAIVFAVNGHQGNFYIPNTLLIVDGEVIAKTAPGVGQDEDKNKFEPLSGSYNFFILDADKLGIRTIGIENGKPAEGEDISDIRRALSGPILRDSSGNNVSANVKQVPKGKVVLKTNEVTFDPGETPNSISLIGLERRTRRVVVLTMIGQFEGDERDEMVLKDINPILDDLDLTDVILLGTSADAQQYVVGEKDIKAKPRKGGQLTQERVLANIIYARKKSLDNKSSDPSMVSSPVNFNESEFWKNMDAKVKLLIENEENVGSKLEDNKRILNSQGELMSGVCAFLNQSNDFRRHFHGLQMRIAKILGDQEKLDHPALLSTAKASYVDPDYSHVTLVGDLLKNWEQSVDAGKDLEETLKTVTKTSLTSVGPHLSEGMSIVYQLDANDNQLAGLRKKSEDWSSKYSDKVYFPPIYHAAVMYFKDVTPQQLAEINQILQDVREDGSKYIIPINYVNIAPGKTNRTFINAGTRYTLADAQKGGIDLNEINVDRRGAGVDIQFDPIQVQEMIDMGVTGFSPVIINLVPLPSILPLLGLAPQREEDEEFELSQMN